MGGYRGWMGRGALWCMCLFGGQVINSSRALAAEQACNALGANCVCATTLSATSWVKSSLDYGTSAVYYEANQDLSDPKRCGVDVDGRKGTLWTFTSTAPTVATGLKGLPAVKAPWTLTVEPSGEMKNTLPGKRVG